MSNLDGRRVPQGAGRWGGRASLAQDAQQNLERPEGGGNAISSRSRSVFRGRQGVGRPSHQTPTGSPNVSASDGSRFEVIHDATDPKKPWVVVDSEDGKEKRFETQEDAENHLLKENAKSLKKETDDRREIKESSGRWGGRASDRAGTRDMATDPPVSEAQRRWAFANRDKGGKEGAAAKEFAEADPGGKLPEKAG